MGSSVYHPFSPPLTHPLHRHPLSVSSSSSSSSSAHSHHQNLNLKTPSLTRRSLLLLSTSLPLSDPVSLAAAELSPATPPPPPPPDTTVTDRVFLEFSICPSYFRSDRSLADDATTCPDSRPLGRLVLGLYGKLVPRTVANFKSMCTGSAGSTYRGTLIHKIFPGQYFVAGRQGRRDKGEVRPPVELASNTETVDSKSFLLKHLRPGTLSLCLSENDDEDAVKLDPNYRNVEFLITTGPAPCPQLDNQNIVFGSVLDGMDVVTAIAAIPTFKPAERIRQFNDFAEFLGDERAQNARVIWNRPLETIYISDCGELKVATPSLSPSLP